MHERNGTWPIIREQVVRFLHFFAIVFVVVVIVVVKMYGREGEKGTVGDIAGVCWIKRFENIGEVGFAYCDAKGSI